MARKWQGMNWIRKDLRLAIMDRDGFACVYCGTGIEDTRLTLDHVIPASHFERRNLKLDNSPTNLVTACINCNSARSDRPVAIFVRDLLRYMGSELDSKQLTRYVLNQRKKPLDRQRAKRVLARRASWAGAIDEVRNGR